MTNSVTQTPFLTVREAADFLRFKISAIRMKTQKKVIPFSKVGGKILFNKKELINKLIMGV